MPKIALNLLSLILFNFFLCVMGNGRLLVPPARSSAWREYSSKFPFYLEDDKMSCGGPIIQWSLNDGKCGICGEEYRSKKYFEKNGDGYRGYIVRSYSQGETFKVKVELTKNLLGYFEFRICNVDELLDDASQDCLDQNLLSTKTGQTKFYFGLKLGIINFELDLPTSLNCEHCVFQWKYTTARAIDPLTKRPCLSCSYQLQEFYGCSDIRILAKSQKALKRNNTHFILMNQTQLKPKNIQLRNIFESNRNNLIKNFLIKKYFNPLVKRDYEQHFKIDIPPLAPKKIYKIPPTETKTEKLETENLF